MKLEVDRSAAVCLRAHLGFLCPSFGYPSVRRTSTAWPEPGRSPGSGAHGMWGVTGELCYFLLQRGRQGVPLEHLLLPNVSFEQNASGFSQICIAISRIRGHKLQGRNSKCVLVNRILWPRWWNWSRGPEIREYLRIFKSPSFIRVINIWGIL